MRKFLTVALLFISSSAFAGSYQEEIDNFFVLYESGKVPEAVDHIYQTNPWMNTASDEIVQIKTQLSSLENLAGKNMGKELISTNNIKDRFVQATYLLLYERQPIRAEFQFYKPKNEWVIYSFSFDTDFDEDVKSAARAKAANGKGL